MASLVQPFAQLFRGHLFSFVFGSLPVKKQSLQARRGSLSLPSSPYNRAPYPPHQSGSQFSLKMDWFRLRQFCLRKKPEWASKLRMLAAAASVPRARNPRHADDCRLRARRLNAQRATCSNKETTSALICFIHTHTYIYMYIPLPGYRNPCLLPPACFLHSCACPEPKLSGCPRLADQLHSHWYRKAV